MEVIPLTLAISLLLSLTFIVLFVREFTRPRRAGAEHDSLLPLEADFSPRVPPPAFSPAAAVPDSSPGHGHADGDACREGKPGAGCCNACQRRKDRAALRASSGPRS